AEARPCVHRDGDVAHGGACRELVTTVEDAGPELLRAGIFLEDPDGSVGIGMTEGGRLHVRVEAMVRRQAPDACRPDVDLRQCGLDRSVAGLAPRRDAVAGRSQPFLRVERDVVLVGHALAWLDPVLTRW